MNTIQKSVDLIRNTYGTITIPSVRSPAFLSLVDGTKQLIDMTLADSVQRANSLRITFEAGAMASTDLKMNIAIPAWYCLKESLEELTKEPLSNSEAKALSLVMINGSSIHEALHVRYSESLMTFMIALARGDRAVEDKNLYEHMLQIVEDLKNETIIENEPSLFEFINAKNNIMFNDKILVTCSSFPEDMTPGAKALDLLVFFKRKTLRSELLKRLADLGFSNAGELLLAACDTDARTFDIAEKLYEIFKEELNEQKAKFPKATPFKNTKWEKIISGIASESKKASGVPSDVIVNFSSVDDVGKVIEVDALSLHTDRASLEKSTLDFSFVKKLKISRELSQAINESRTRGCIMVPTRLSRIAIDNKIFTTRGESLSSFQMKQPTFIILVDASGSMHLLFYKVLSTVSEMAKAMISSGVHFSVYAHTSTRENYQPLLIHIFSNMMNGKSSDRFDYRFSKAAGISLSENLDGHIINHLREKFPSQGKKVMIVLSDGMPNSPNYNDSHNHTKIAIQKTRNSGIKVIALSLVAGVIDHNNAIYDKEYNVDATSQAKLEAGMKAVIMGK